MFQERVVPRTPVFWAVLALLSPALTFANPACEQLLSQAERAAVAKVTLREISAESPFFKKLLLKAMSHPVKSRALKACQANASCTREDVARAVRESVEQLSSDLKLARGYAIIIAAWGAGAGSATYLNTIESMRLYAPVAAIITGVGLSWISAPIMERVAGKVRRGVYGLVGMDNGAKQGSMNAELETYYLETQATLSPLAQVAGQRMNLFLDSLDMKAAAARVAMTSGQSRLAVDQLAEIIVRMRELFPDVRPDHKAVSRVVQTSFLGHVERPATLRDELLARVKQLDGSAEAAGYYERVVDTWLE